MTSFVVTTRSRTGGGSVREGRVISPRAPYDAAVIDLDPLGLGADGRCCALAVALVADRGRARERRARTGSGGLWWLLLVS